MCYSHWYENTQNEKQKICKIINEHYILKNINSIKKPVF